MKCVVCKSQTSGIFAIKGGKRIVCCPECRERLAFHIFKNEIKARNINKVLSFLIIILLIILAFVLGAFMGGQ